jgi:hypothetical protein
MTRSGKIYSARVEYYAVREEVEKKLAAGHRVRPIYEELAAAGRLTISYSSFCAYVRGQGQRANGRKTAPTGKPSSPGRPQAVKPAMKVIDRGGFHHDPNVDLDELVGPGLKPI